MFARLADNGIRLVDETQLTDDQKVYLRQFFYDKLNGLVNPIWLNEIDNLGRLEDNRIYQLVERKETGDDGKTRYAIVKTSPSQPTVRRPSASLCPIWVLPME